jgi:hypothetical protein
MLLDECGQPLDRLLAEFIGGEVVEGEGEAGHLGAPLLARRHSALRTLPPILRQRNNGIAKTARGSVSSRQRSARGDGHAIGRRQQ